MADDRLELKCDYCAKTQPIAILHGTNYRAFMDVERLQTFIHEHIACGPVPVLRFESARFTVVTEMEPYKPDKDCPYASHSDDCDCQGMGGPR